MVLRKVLLLDLDLVLGVGLSYPPSELDWTLKSIESNRFCSSDRGVGGSRGFWVAIWRK